MDSTISKSARPRAPGPSRAAWLCVAIECDRPLRTARRCDLEGADEVTVGRGTGPPRGSPGPAGRALEVLLDDPRASSPHARLLRLRGGWVLEDLRSKNGVLRNGRRVSQARLSPGDILEIGHTLLLFGETSGARAEEEPPGRAAAPPHPDLETLVPSLAGHFAALARVAASAAPILVSGETGTGKELAARAAHALSGRSGAFVPVNCAAIPASLVESELFGVRRGAFSGATESRVGLVRASSGGTLFLDEVGDLAPASQAALLRVLSEGEVLPVGETRAEKVDLRVVSATHRDLEAMVARGEFRADLLARLSGFRARLPALRERREDLGLLVARLLPRVAGERARELRLSCPAGFALLRHGWPGNVRELERTLAVAAALADRGVLELEHLPEALRPGAGGEGQAPAEEPALGPEDRALRERLEGLLVEHGGNVAAVARVLGKARMQVHRWMKRCGIRPASFRGP